MGPVQSTDARDSVSPSHPSPNSAPSSDYLDYVDLRISRYIAAKQKLIDLLEEEKQAIINQAVTRGLDPNVRLKPSGVEWLGDVPEHWEVLPVKRAFLSRDYGICGIRSDSGAIRLLTMGHLKDGQVIVPNDGGVALPRTFFCKRVTCCLTALIAKSSSAKLVYS